MLSKVVRQSFVELNRCAASRFKLLLHLEKETCDMREILCHTCQVFHPPTSSNLEEGNGGIRTCARGSLSQQDWSTSSPYLPTTVHFNMVKAVMRSYRCRLDLYDPRLLFSSVLYVDEATNAKARYTATSLIADNQLLLRTVVTLLPSPIRGEARSAAPNLLQLVNERPGLRNVCLHIEWSWVYPNIFDDKPPPPPTGEPLADAWNPRIKPNPMRGYPESCKYCWTLFHFNYTDLKVSGARVVSLVSYKLLGRGEDFNDRLWVLHTQEAAEEEKRNLRISYLQMHPTDAWCRGRPKLPEYGGRSANLDPFCYEGLDTVTL
ncbi:hypothetical protein CMUS01_05775 [Colletotrichum musicola]|uniref:Uncharacterized protein n=1 Tax=Colletotrichum musicola TaxID=2175873 RepID=A0A8H6KQI4_9PEZI|nr:hypothetical protein CMUS01_05775 [Colletotrichum musicola]